VAARKVAALLVPQGRWGDLGHMPQRSQIAVVVALKVVRVDVDADRGFHGCVPCVAHVWATRNFAITLRHCSR